MDSVEYKEIMKKGKIKMNKKILISLLFLINATSINAQQTTSGIQERINKIKEQLGDKLLTTADEVIERHVEAVGGRNAILSVKTLMYRGRNVRFGQGDNPLLRYYQQPHFVRQMRSPESTSYILSDGEKVWQVTPSERREIDAWWAKITLHERIDGNFIDYKKRGIVYEYIGLEGFATEPFVYYHLRRTFPDGEIEDLYFDVETGLLHGIWPTSSQRGNSPRFYYDYRDVGGILYPHVYMRVFDTANPPHLFIIEEVRINEDFGSDFFTEYKNKPVKK